MGNIRILHVVSSLSKSSGVMSVIMNYYRHINRDKVQFDFLYFKNLDNTYINEIEHLGGRVFLIPKPSISKRFRDELVALFNQQRGVYTAIHIHEVYLTFLLAPLAKKYGINHIITHSHATMYSGKKFSAIRNRILCIPLKKSANHYFSCSRAAGEFLYGKKNLNRGKVTIINNAIDCTKFKYNEFIRNKMRKELELQNNFVIGHVGRFSEEKNHTFLIDIFHSIKIQKGKAKLVLVGDGPLISNMKEKVKKLNLDNDVIFLGRRNDIPNLLQAMDIFILPSLFEGLPVVGVEAQASGLPIVISTNITREIGLLNAQYIDLEATPEHWAESILNVKKNTNRKNGVNILREKGFDISIEATKLENIYLNMVKKKDY